MSYKSQHEKFVSGNDGTTALHIAIVGIACIIPVYIKDAICVILSENAKSKLENSLW